MKKVILIILYVVVLINNSLFGQSLPNEKQAVGYPHSDATVEFNFSGNFGSMLFICFTKNGEQGVAMGGEFNWITSSIREYDWSQDRAEGFYKSTFTGYGKKRLFSFCYGYVRRLLVQNLYLYGTVGMLTTRQYRTYYDNTFTTWDKKYYIKDNVRSKTNLELIAGAYYILDSGLLLSIKYSSELKCMIGIGFSRKLYLQS